MLYLNDLKTKGVWKIRLYLADAWPEDCAEEKEAYDGLWVELREPTGEEAMALNTNREQELLPMALKCLADHNIEKEPSKKASNKEVADVIAGSSTLSTFVVRGLLENIPLVKVTGGSSDK